MSVCCLPKLTSWSGAGAVTSDGTFPTAPFIFAESPLFRRSLLLLLLLFLLLLLEEDDFALLEDLAEPREACELARRF